MSRRYAPTRRRRSFQSLVKRVSPQVPSWGIFRRVQNPICPVGVDGTASLPSTPIAERLVGGLRAERELLPGLERVRIRSDVQERLELQVLGHRRSVDED